MQELKGDQSLGHPSVKALLELLTDSSDAKMLVESLAGIHDRFSALDDILEAILTEYEQFGSLNWRIVLAALREETGTLAELSPVLAEWLNCLICLRTLCGMRRFR